MSLIEDLEKYTRFSKGDLTQECSLVVCDDCIDTLDFSSYDLNNSVFSGVTFNNCKFDTVYLSGSNFGGSIFKQCRFRSNILRKAEWNYISMNNTCVYNMEAFRTEFFNADLCDCLFIQCRFSMCLFCNSEDTMIRNVVFKSCVFERTELDECVFHNTTFDECQFKGIKMADVKQDGVTLNNCVEI